MFLSVFLLFFLHFSPDEKLSAIFLKPVNPGGVKTIYYTYDSQGNRLSQTIATGTTNTTTTYPNQNYSATFDNFNSNTQPQITKHVFANQLDIATINGVGSSAKTYFNHADSLNSSSVMTDGFGNVAETTDYFPFGSMRLDTKLAGSSLNNQRKYIDQYYDADTGLDYLNARYYNPSTGRFLSQDSEFWSGHQNLMDPQSLNAYSYARNNPIVMSDPSGLCVDGVSTIACVAAWGLLGTIVAGHIAIVTGAITGNDKAIETGFALNDIGIAGGTGFTGGSPLAPSNYKLSQEGIIRGIDGSFEGTRREDNYVYRGLAKGENSVNGLVARNVNSTKIDPISHIAGLRDSPWISATKDLEIAQNKYGENGVVGIDLNKINTKVLDLSNGIEGLPKNNMLNNFVIKDQEVLIWNKVPANAIKIINKSK